jgi:predicted acetyltransferase
VAADIRHPVPDDADSLIRCMNTGFLNPARLDAPMSRFWLDTMKPDLDRTWAAYDRGEVVGTLRSIPFTLTVPGGADLPADGVTMVTVAATHRRRGLLSAMMGPALADAADRGDAVSILIASEWLIYGRYGFGAATEAVEWSIERARARVAAPMGELAYVGIEELRDVGPAAYERMRRQRAGGLTRETRRWERTIGLLHMAGEQPDWDGRSVVHRDAAGEVDGYLRWHAEWPPGGEGQLTVDELVAATPAAYADLWRFALSVDLIGTVKARHRPVDEPLPWLLTDARAAQQVERYDRVWLRMLDVPAALTARTYGAEGRVVVEVVDPAGYGAGRFALDASPAGTTCEPTTASPDLTLPVTTLGSVYLGGHRLAALAAVGLADEHTDGAVAAADRLFATDRAPWCPIHF